MSVYEMGSGENSSRFLPATALSPVVTICRSSYAQNSELPSRTMRGPVSRHFFGSRSVQSVAGSIRWSSTEMNQLNVMRPPARVVRRWEPRPRLGLSCWRSPRGRRLVDGMRSRHRSRHRDGALRAVGCRVFRLRLELEGNLG